MDDSDWAFKPTKQGTQMSSVLGSRANRDQPFRLGVLISHPIQYFAPLFRYLARSAFIELTVFYLSDFSLKKYYDQGFGVHVHWDVPLLGGYNHVFLPSINQSDSLSFWRPWSYGLARHLRERRIEALWISGWSSAATLRALLTAKRHGVKVFMAGDSHAGGPTVPSWWKLKAKGILLPPFFALMDAFLATASSNRRFYIDYGVPAGRIYLVPYCVDNDFFQRECRKAVFGRPELRRQLGLEPGRPVILYASKLIERKKPIDLLRAYAELSPDGICEPNPYLLFVGDGEQRQQLENLARQFKWNSVRFLGFKNQLELPRYYDLCDVFVLAAQYEGLATVIPEVMNAAKPVIISTAIGLGSDLVTDGDNGFIIPPSKPHILAEKLRIVTQDVQLAAAMGRRSLTRVSEWNFEADEQGLLEALKATVGRIGSANNFTVHQNT
jgi:glycosyltransferase involved in cell wall biosynthesis